MKQHIRLVLPSNLLRDLWRSNTRTIFERDVGDKTVIITIESIEWYEEHMEETEPFLSLLRDGDEKQGGGS